MEIASLGGETMGTTWSVRMTATRATDLRARHAGIEAVLARIVAEMSTWDADSDISRFNRAPVGSVHDLPRDFCFVLECALQIARDSDGAFDPTVGALVGSWGFGAGALHREDPDAPRLRHEAARCVGWQRLVYSAGRITQTGDVQLDLSAIAKGYAADAVARWLRSVGVMGALVEVGGELHGMGCKPDGSAWRVVLEDAGDGDDTPPRVVELRDAGVASSGDRWHQYEQNETLLTHTLDPRNGQPLPARAMVVSVVATSAMQADGWATALRVLGPERGLRVAESKGLAARFHWLDNGRVREVVTPAMTARLCA